MFAIVLEVTLHPSLRTLLIDGAALLIFLALGWLNAALVRHGRPR